MREQRFIDGVDGRRVGKRSKGKRVFLKNPQLRCLEISVTRLWFGGKLVEDIVGDKSTCSSNHGYPGGAADLSRRPEYLTRLMCNQMIPNIVLIFEIKIEGTFCTPALFTISEMDVLLKPLLIKVRKQSPEGTHVSFVCCCQFFPQRVSFPEKYHIMCHLLNYNYS